MRLAMFVQAHNDDRETASVLYWVWNERTEGTPMSDEYLNLQEGMSAYQSARLRAFWEEMSGLLRGKSAELLSFEDVLCRDLDHLSLCHQQTYFSCSNGVMRS